jgi:NRAMP (natural resistance-associated macrophage protein)-like metal ion transporter
MNKLKKLFGKLGPGFVTGASDDDPSGIATYSQTGAIFGYTQLWTALYTLPFMYTIQEICGRIGLVTGKGLAGVIKRHYSKKILFISVGLLAVANTVNIGANLGAMAESLGLLIPIPFVILLLIVTFGTLALEIFVPYKTYSKYLKYLAFVLLAYVATFFIVDQNWSEIIKSTLIPQITLSKEYFLNIVAILGTTISPYLFFWQASQEVEEEVEGKVIAQMGQGTPQIHKSDIRKLRVDTGVGMFLSNLVMFFIIATTASTLYAGGVNHITSAAQAASALKPLAGDFAFLLFAIGIVGIGLLSVPVLAGSVAYATSEAFGWKEGLYRKFGKAKAFYLVIIIATLVGMFINVSPINPFELLYYTAVLNGICAPILMVMLMLIGNNQKVMGKFVNSRKTNIVGWSITAIMSVCGGLLVLSSI